MAAHASACPGQTRPAADSPLPTEFSCLLVISRRQLGGAPPVLPIANPLPFPTIPLPADRGDWPTLNSTVMARVVHAMRLHNCFPDARAVIGFYGGSSELLVPLFRAQTAASTAPVALESALGGTGQPLRLAYVLSGLGRSAAEHPSLLPFALGAIRLLLASGMRRDDLIAAYLAERLADAFGEVFRAAMASPDFDQLRSTATSGRPKMQTSWDPDTGYGITTIQPF